MLGGIVTGRVAPALQDGEPRVSLEITGACYVLTPEQARAWALHLNNAASDAEAAAGDIAARALAGPVLGNA